MNSHSLTIHTLEGCVQVEDVSIKKNVHMLDCLLDELDRSRFYGSNKLSRVWFYRSGNWTARNIPPVGEHTCIHFQLAPRGTCPALIHTCTISVLYRTSLYMVWLTGSIFSNISGGNLYLLLFNAGAISFTSLVTTYENFATCCITIFNVTTFYENFL